MLYGFIFVLFLFYILHLKSKLIEGNMQGDIYKSFKEFESETPEVELPLKKISKILELILKKMTGEKDVEGKCEGEFVINKLTEKICGDGFNERIYNITKPGEDCLHSKYYKEKVPLRLCKYNEKCDTDLDCGAGQCKDNLCTYELECNETMLSSCNRDMCLALNDGLDRAIYYYQNNECKVDPCNENTFRLCDEGGCNDLSYKYKFNKEKNVCEKVIKETDKTGLEVGSYLNMLQSFKDKYVSVDDFCKGKQASASGIKSCNIGADLKPRYYCEDGYWNGSGSRGSSSPCVKRPTDDGDNWWDASGYCPVMQHQDAKCFFKCPAIIALDSETWSIWDEMVMSDRDGNPLSKSECTPSSVLKKTDIAAGTSRLGPEAAACIYPLQVQWSAICNDVSEQTTAGAGSGKSVDDHTADDEPVYTKDVLDIKKAEGDNTDNEWFDDHGYCPSLDPGAGRCLLKCEDDFWTKNAPLWDPDGGGLAGKDACAQLSTATTTQLIIQTNLTHENHIQVAPEHCAPVVTHWCP